MKSKIYVTTALVLMAILLARPEKGNAQKIRAGIIAFYNLENLFDTLDTPGVLDTEFTPDGPKHWTSEKYWTKINNLGRVIARIGSHENINGPAILGVSEVENRTVLEDLVHSEHLKNLNYQIVHYDSPDERGVDVALLYQPRYFKITNARNVPLFLLREDGERDYTRDQLVVSGLFDGDPMHIIVNHWPSRYGGQKASAPLRIEAAKLTRSLVDSIRTIHPNDKIVIMGDLNDDPIDKSVKKYLNTEGKQQKIKDDQLYNPMETLYKKGIGSLAYQGKWNLFDQIIITPNMLEEQDGYRLNAARIFNDAFLLRDAGRYKKYPHRTFVGNDFQGGYSDHLPVYIIVVKNIR